MNTLALILGRKGAGKTTLLRALTLRALERHPGFRAVVYDQTAEWSAHPPRARVAPERLEVLRADEVTVEEAARRALALAAEHGGCVLVLDEVDAEVPNHAGALRSERKPGGSPLHTIVHYGRHRRTALWCAARRPANVSQDLVALANVVYVMQTTHPRDLKRIEELGGPEAAAEAVTLEPGEFIRLDL